MSYEVIFTLLMKRVNDNRFVGVGMGLSDAEQAKIMNE
jgi:hypothetical protein